MSSTFAVVVGVAVVLLVASAVYYVLRAQRRKHYLNRISAAPRPLSDPGHPANSIVPFRLDDDNNIHRDGPRPIADGTNMRVAFQREDGSWHFTGAHDAFDPATMSDLDLEAQKSKSAEAKKAKMAADHSRNTSASSSMIDVPPPSYSQIDASPLNATP
ncbi:hypothetical protein FA95DRAFT_1573749 [Auriscalpium vulgare]|uniref:Uncharacterized protein n=1 Tax=Auriscalpium vulgare TaxID=40419 RepID=A0ACB8RPJ6_9AGAM|nr:hypothetical protein FA95DRAFT_1573749 [Auriscalpium vulgare]